MSKFSWNFLIENRQNIGTKAYKWLDLISRMKLGISKSASKFQEKALRGIPDSIRCVVWQAILDPFRFFNKETINLQSFADCADPQKIKLIENDIGRTLVNIPKYKSEEGRQSLKKVLAAYAGVDKELGYAQGMAFPAAMLLLYLDETNAFLCFYQLMLSPRFGIREVYMGSFNRINNLNVVWDNLLNRQFPNLHQILNEAGIEPIMYTTGWWMAAFSNINLPLEIMLLIFDRFLIFGSPALLSFGLTIVGLSIDAMISKPVDVIVSILQTPTPYIKDYTVKEIKTKWNNYWLTKKEYKKILSIAQIPYFS